MGVAKNDRKKLNRILFKVILLGATFLKNIFWLRINGSSQEQKESKDWKLYKIQFIMKDLST